MRYATKHKRSASVLEDFPYGVKFSQTHVREEHVRWLDQNMPNSYRSRWTYSGPYQINFADEQDRLMFALRWA